MSDEDFIEWRHKEGDRFIVNMLNHICAIFQNLEMSKEEKIKLMKDIGSTYMAIAFYAGGNRTCQQLLAFQESQEAIDKARKP